MNLIPILKINQVFLEVYFRRYLNKNKLRSYLSVEKVDIIPSFLQKKSRQSMALFYLKPMKPTLKTDEPQLDDPLKAPMP